MTICPVKLEALVRAVENAGQDHLTHLLRDAEIYDVPYLPSRQRQ